MSEQKRTRGKGVKPALVHVNLRVPAWVVEHYKQQPNYTGAMRDVLVQHVIDKQTPTPT